MKAGLTEIVCVLDMTGSMHTQTKDTIGGFNGFIDDQRKVPGDCKVTVVFFNSAEHKEWLNGVDLKDVPPLTEEIYQARMNTPLYDAIAKTINTVGGRLSETPEGERPEKVLFVIMTDGEENWSKEFNKAKVVEMIRHQRERYSWEFIFLGADLDSFGQGKQLGINLAVNYCGSTKKGYSIVSRAAVSARSGKKIEGFGK